MLDISHLNDAQRGAVTAPDGPALVLAGAGSGKTRVLTYRIAYLIEERGVEPWRICAVTFTNKAAGEMAERVRGLVPRGVGGYGNERAITVSTFHSLCARFLRQDAAYLGYGQDFVIYDDSDTMTLIKRVLKDMNLAQEKHSPRLFRRLMDEAKNNLKGPKDVEAGLMAAKHFPEIYARYQAKLKENNALDFGDLIRLSVQLFERHPEVLTRYRERYPYLLVDEYQDTNVAQYRWTRLLAGADAGRSLKGPFVVGDEDQSIYAFRGADISNILNFQKDFPTATVVRLEQNYRSTETILKAANAVVSFNQQRLGKNLWSAQGKGETVRLFEQGSEQDEAARVAEEMRRLRAQGFTFGDMAVFYRANSLSRPFEEQLFRAGIPYKLVGQGFYDRKEIKDTRAYLQVLLNPLDDVNLERIINTPTRGIGAKSILTMYEIARREGISAYDALGYLHRHPSEGGRGGNKLADFWEMMERLRERARELGPQSLIKEVLTQSGYRDRLEQEESVESESRLSNLDELMNVAAELEGTPGLLGLQTFLERMALRSGADEVPDEGGMVTLMTLHMAKGLEFPVVFLVGMEMGLFPNARAEDEGQIEEERRLCYVGMTRAMRRLYLTRARRRRHQGETRMTEPSTFLREIPPDLIVGRGMGSGVGHLARRYGVGGASPPRAPVDPNERRVVPMDEVEGSVPMPPRPARTLSPSWGASASLRPAPTAMPGAPRRRATVSSGEDGGPFEHLQVGRDVLHPQLGEGRIIARQGPDDNPRLTIIFKDFGKKKIMARMAHLEPVFS